MVQSTATTVDVFLAEVAADRIDAIRRVRDACRARLIGREERMQWGMPGYGPPGGDAPISFNNQKGYIAVYLGKSTIDERKALIKDTGFGEGRTRYSHADRIDFDLLGEMLSCAFRAKGAPPSTSPADAPERGPDDAQWDVMLRRIYLCCSASPLASEVSAPAWVVNANRRNHVALWATETLGFYERSAPPARRLSSPNGTGGPDCSGPPFLSNDRTA